MTTIEQMVEAGARAKWPRWDDFPEEWRKPRRKQIEEIIHAALPILGEELFVAVGTNPSKAYIPGNDARFDQMVYAAGKVLQSRLSEIMEGK